MSRIGNKFRNNTPIEHSEKPSYCAQGNARKAREVGHGIDTRFQRDYPGTSFEGILGTKTQQTHRDLQARLDFTEQYQIRLDESKLCLEVGVRSPRARDVLHGFHRSVFSVGFEERPLRLDEEGFLWASVSVYSPDRL